MLLNRYLSVFGLLLPSTFAVKLYVSHYNGSVYTLDLAGSGNNYSLTQTSAIQAGGVMPSWLTYDASNGTLYSVDESNPGSLTSFAAPASGKLVEIAKATAPGGGVAAVLHGGSSGRGNIAVANYGTAAISTFKLPLSSSSQAQQTLQYDATSHPHQVTTDPTGMFLLAPDLGADAIRVFKIDQATGQLTSCPNLNVTTGTGPRHAVFWQSDSASRLRRRSATNMLYVANELSNDVKAFSVEYGACLSFVETQTTKTFGPNVTIPAKAAVGEIRVKGNFLYVSNRGDQTFSPDDSISIFAIRPCGKLVYIESRSSHGKYPRTFVINDAGDLAAIGNQFSSNVAIVKRNTTTGNLGPEVANLAVGPEGDPSRGDGLSSVVWAESMC